MAVAGEIAVNVVARTQRYSSGLNRAKKDTLGFKNAVSGTIGKVGSFIGVAGGITGAMYAASRAVTSLREKLIGLDEGIKTAKRLGLTHAELMGLHTAAKISGVGVSTLDMALQRMTRRVAEAAEGTGEAKAALVELGLSAKELNRIGPYQALRRIADAMQGVESQSDKVRLAFKLFDSEGVKLINTLDGGSESLDKFRREAIKTGLALDLFSQEQVERANDAITEAKEGFSGIGTGMAVRFAPLIEGAGKGMKVLGSTIGGAKAELIELQRVAGREAILPFSEKAVNLQGQVVQQTIQKAAAAAKAAKAREAEAAAAKDQEKTEQKITAEMIKRQQFAGAAIRGTSEAYSAIVQGRAEQIKQLQFEQDQLVEQKLMNNKLQVIANTTNALLQKGGTFVVQDLR